MYRLLKVSALAALATSLSLVGASAATAAITSTSVTSPAHGTAIVSDDSAGAPAVDVTFTGTSNASAPADTVNLRCYFLDDSGALDYESIESSVATDDVTGAWTHTENMQGWGRSCLIRAVPTSFDNFAAFTGPTMYFAYYILDKVSGGPHDGKVYGFYAQSGQSGAYNDYGSINDDGVYDSHLYSGSRLRESAYLWYYSAALAGGTGYPVEGLGGVKVDGNFAYTSDAAAVTTYNGTGGMQLAGWKAPTFTFTHVPATGALNVTETEPILRCNVDANVATPTALCTDLVDTGIAIKRTFTFSTDGRQIHVSDAWMSTDGAAHTVNASYWEAHNDEEGVGFRFPWINPSVYSLLTDGQVLPVPTSAPWSYNATSAYLSEDGDLSYGKGGRITSVLPTNLQAETGTNTDLVHTYAVSVPAAGSATIDHGFVHDTQQAKVDAGVTAFADLWTKPTVAITSPAGGSTVTSTPATVTGTASDKVGIATVTVNGVSATVTAGTWTASVPLSVGANTLSVVAKDAAGNEATASVTITFTPPVVIAGPQKVFNGTSGNDTLRGNEADNELNGLDGNDNLLCGVGGKDAANGGAGNDRIECVESYATGKANKDTIDCGSGKLDVAIVDPFDTVKNCEKVTRVWNGGAKADKWLAVKARNDRFNTLGGNDSVTCNGGIDTALLGAGNDTVNCWDAGSAAAKKRSKDIVNCGAGTKDVAIVDRYDVVRFCEKVIRKA